MLNFDKDFSCSFHMRVFLNLFGDVNGFENVDLGELVVHKIKVDH